MGFWKQKKQQQPVAPPQVHHPSEPDDPRLPGTAGYRGAARLTKNAMPVSRFNFKRPDGRD
jgi:hypothetical protein